MSRAREIWANLAPPTTALRWTATPFKDGVRIARTPKDGAAILYPNDGTVDAAAFGLRTAHVSYDTGRPLAIEGDASGERPFLVLECADTDSGLVGQFLDVVDSISLGGPKASDFDTKVRAMFELFRTLSGRGTGTAQGLWAELALFTIAEDPDYLAAAWHSDPKELHDFVGDGSRLEVKSTTRPIREHDFALEQLEYDRDATVIASIMLVENSSGANVFELLEQILLMIKKPDLRNRVYRVARETLGEQWREASDQRFDLPQSIASLAFCAASDVPRVQEPLPAAIRNVRFTADLSQTVKIASVQRHKLLRAIDWSPNCTTLAGELGRGAKPNDEGEYQR